MRTVRATPEVYLFDALREHIIPEMLLPINIIHYEWRRPCGLPARVGLEICENFDIVACGVFLDVQADLAYEFYEATGAFHDLHPRCLSLRPFAFACQRDEVDWQMSRIREYCLRGFSYQPAASIAPPRYPFGIPRSVRQYAQHTCEWDNASSSCSETTREQNDMRVLRVRAASGAAASFDYWVCCQDGGDTACDPIRLQLRSAHGLRF